MIPDPGVQAFIVRKIQQPDLRQVPLCRTTSTIDSTKIAMAIAPTIAAVRRAAARRACIFTVLSSRLITPTVRTWMAAI
ncbi:MAG: hypothetical protein WBV61_05925 [Rhodanobacteraceae bacterium]